MRSDKAPWLLLVEDEEADAMILREAVLAGKARALRLEVAATAKDGLERLRARTAAQDPPALVLLDLRLPADSGFDLLGWVRQDQALALLPVLILTTSSAASDIRQAYAAGANAFITKPSSFGDCVRMMDIIAEFWLEWARLPQEAARQAGG